MGDEYFEEYESEGEKEEEKVERQIILTNSVSEKTWGRGVVMLTLWRYYFTTKLWRLGKPGLASPIVSSFPHMKQQSHIPAGAVSQL